MPLYAFIGFDNPSHSIALRETLRGDHRAYVQDNDGGAATTGALYDAQGSQCGTLTIFQANNAEEVWDWYRNEPFYRSGVYKECHVIEWRMALNKLKPTGGWVQNYKSATR